MLNDLPPSGCDNKVRWSSLKTSLQRNSIPNLAADSVSLNCVGELYSSIDTIFPIPCDLETFGRLAVIHCQNDVVAAGCRPCAISISIGLDEGGTIEALDQIVSGVLDQAASDNIQFGKGHTYFATRTEITCSVIGAKKAAPLFIDSSETFSLIATKPLGGKALYEKAFLAGDEVLKSEILQQMLVSNAKLPDLLSNCWWQATDVSGYGMVGALSLFAERHGLTIEIERSLLKYHTSALQNVRICKLVGANEADFEVSLTSSLGDPYRNVLYESEFCGPLIFLTSKSGQDDMLRLLINAGYNAYAFGKAVLGPPRLIV